MDKAKIKYDTHERYIIEGEPDWQESLTCGVCTTQNKYKVILYILVLLYISHYFSIILHHDLFILL
jgi:hypothetical protein